MPTPLHLNLTAKQNELELSDGSSLHFKKVAQKLLYEEALMRISTDHHYQTKWVDKLGTAIVWDEVWKCLHENCLATNRIKTIIWEQLHLNFYTQFSYNKWHNTQDPCPLCKEIPLSIYHTLLECKITTKAWNELEITLYKIYEVPLSNEEKAVGIFENRKNEGVLLRNWLTFILRKAISDAERECYYKSSDSMRLIKRNFRNILQKEMFLAILRGSNQCREDFVKNVLLHNNIVCARADDGV